MQVHFLINVLGLPGIITTTIVVQLLHFEKESFMCEYGDRTFVDQLYLCQFQLLIKSDTHTRGYIDHSYN
jgi:hypothetical protein